MPLCSSQPQAALWHSQQPGKISTTSAFSPISKKTLSELRVWKGEKNWGSSEMIPAITSPVTDQKPEPFLAPRTHEVFRGWCSVEELPENQWLGGRASSLHTEKLGFSPPRIIESKCWHHLGRRKSTIVYFWGALTHNGCQPLAACVRKGLAQHSRLFQTQMAKEQQRGDGSGLGTRQHKVLGSTQPDRKGEDSGLVTGALGARHPSLLWERCNPTPRGEAAANT